MRDFIYYNIGECLIFLASGTDPTVPSLEEVGIRLSTVL